MFGDKRKGVKIIQESVVLRQPGGSEGGTASSSSLSFTDFYLAEGDQIVTE
jgi:hypothetical protein